MGAGSTVVALSQGLSVQRLVLLASIASLKGALHRFAGAVGLPPHLFPAFQDGVRQEIGVPLEALELDALRPHFQTPVLLFHDPDDQEVPFADGQALAHAWPGAQLCPIRGVGHRRMLYEPKIVQEAVAFITGTDSFSVSPSLASGGPL